MSRFYKIKFNNVWLTEDGTESSPPCKLNVPGASDLLMPTSGSTAIAIDGTPINQAFGSGTKGKTIEIKVTRLYKSVWDSVIAIINNSLTTGSVINIVGSNSDIGDFNVNFLPLLPKPYEAQDFSNGRLSDAFFRFVCVE